MWPIQLVTPVTTAAMIGLVSALLGGFEVRGLVPGILAAVVTGVTSWIGHMVVSRRA